MGMGYESQQGDMEHWNACHSASKHNLESPSPLLTTFILDESAAHDLHPDVQKTSTNLFVAYKYVHRL